MLGSRPHPRTTCHAALAAILLAGPCALAQQPGQRKFISPEVACEALFKAAQTNDEPSLLAILGPDGKRIVSSGDAAEDTAARAQFVENYQEMHRLVTEPDGSTVLYIGAENWPTPIPLRDQGPAWFFDTEAGKREILLRRIGRNETSTIRVCLELVEAQKEFRASHDNAFATAINSSPGRHDGLHWVAAPGEARSPVGPLVAKAEAGGPQGPTPFRGYVYRLLPGQGQGFAFVAFPAVYRSSGVMTFLVNQEGIVYEKDLGRMTGPHARMPKGGRPDTSWKKTEEHPE